MTSLPQNVQAETVYYSMSNKNNYHYTLKVETTNYIKSLYLVDWIEHYKGVSDTLYIEEDTTYTSVCSRTYTGAFTGSMEFKKEVPGFGASISLGATIENATGHEDSVSKSFKKGYSSTIPASQKHAFYALEMLKYGDAVKITWTRSDFSGKNEKKKTASINFYPEGPDIPGKRTRKYNTSKLAGNYKDYKKLWKVS